MAGDSGLTILFGLEREEFARLVAGWRPSLVEGRWTGVLLRDGRRVWLCRCRHRHPIRAVKCALAQKRLRVRMYERWVKLQTGA